MLSLDSNRVQYIYLQCHSFPQPHIMIICITNWNILFKIIGPIPCRAYTPLVTNQNIVKKIKIVCNLATIFWPYLKGHDTWRCQICIERYIFFNIFIIICDNGVFLNFILRIKDKCSFLAEISDFCGHLGFLWRHMTFFGFFLFCLKLILFCWQICIVLFISHFLFNSWNQYCEWCKIMKIYCKFPGK